MKAIILAAGYGNRMRPLTDQVHKTLLEVGGKTIIDRIIDSLIDNTITEVVIVTGYREMELREYLVSHYPLVQFTFVHNPRYRETNNIYSMALAFENITFDSDIILIESDLIYHPSVLQRLLKSPYANVALVDHFRSGMDGTVVTVENDIVTNVIPPHLQSDNFDYSDKFKTLNMYKFSQFFCATSFKKLLTYYARVIDDNCYYELILGILIYMQKETIHAAVLDGEKWAEVDDPNDVRVAEFVFNQNRKQILDHSFGGYWNYDVTDYCFIRNMYFPDSAIISEMKNNLPNLIHNYGSRQDVLNQKLAWFLLFKKEYLHVINGASQAYPILQAYFQGKKALIPSPTFGEYPRIFPGAECYADEIGIDPDEIESKAASSDIIVFVNPNNPTGSTLSSEWLYHTARNHQNKTVIVDESFIEFSPYESIITFLEENPLDNVIVVKSLSKSLGIPGMRLGYVYSCNEAFNRHFKAAIPIWNLNSLAEFMLEIILKFRKELRNSFTATIKDRAEFSRLLASLPIVEKVYPSGGNFLLASFSKKGPAIKEIVDFMLSKHSIFIKDVSSKFSDGGKYVRFAVRLPDENERLVRCLSEL